ncbi:MAG: DegT/DnrJ/EryC1/StrS family aminotransferase [Myxococcota bacterium]|jgi:dTDP-4-amino-4,6-dideoxygalactose transaminase|nr:DegT/DnrJ/EryC1/StrS family aminotransferase [Myxococcota bacterium]
MAFGKIPRFSPSFSPSEAFICARYLARSGDDQAIVTQFEDEFARYIGARHAVMVPSARYGCYLLLQGLGVGEGDEVIVPAMTYFAIPAMVTLLGARPVFADIGLHSHVLDPEAFEAAITPRTRAVIPTHLFGTPCDMDAINAIAEKHGVKVIEDCAQSTGARYKGKRVGGLGDASYYTFGLTKNITTLSGAMVSTDDGALASNVRRIAEAATLVPWKKPAKEAFTGLAMYVATHPWVYWCTVHPAVVLGNKLGKDPIHDRFGEAEHTYAEVPSSYLASRPRAVQAAVGRKQLQRIEDLNGARSRNGRQLDQALANVPGLEVPAYPEGAEPIYMSFVVHHDRRDALAEALRDRGVDTTVGYMNDLSDHDLFGEFRTHCPNAAEVKRKLLHVPVHPNLNSRDITHMVQAVRDACMEVGR